MIHASEIRVADADLTALYSHHGQTICIACAHRLDYDAVLAEPMLDGVEAQCVQCGRSGIYGDRSHTLWFTELLSPEDQKLVAAMRLLRMAARDRGDRLSYAKLTSAIDGRLNRALSQRYLAEHGLSA